MSIPRPAGGPLRVSDRNPRYFTPVSGAEPDRAVYLTGLVLMAVADEEWCASTSTDMSPD